MADKLQQELAKVSPDVPFRASASHTHHTWAKTFTSRPELYLRPESLEEIQKIVTLARRCRRRLVVVGCGHSPSDLTCTSSWMVNLDNYSRVLEVNREKKTLRVEGGIRLRALNQRANEAGLTMPNLGSIDEQSIVGAISTATHGSSLKHGLLSQSVRSLKIVLANAQAVRCSKDENEELFRAALCSLGALGIITEIEFEMTDAVNIEWEQTLVPLSQILGTWNDTLWTQKEFTRVWWMPYLKRAIVWSAEKTDKPERQPAYSFYGGSIGYYTYHNLLAVSNYIPSILPWIEWFVFGMQYGFSTGKTTSAVEPLQQGLLMNCLYSQFVNEWALPLSKGPEAITRLSAWMNGEKGAGGIPFSSKRLYVHCPIEVRVSDTSTSPHPRPHLDPTVQDEPTLYLNATLYRPYLQDPPCRDRYYEAFEWLMQDLGGRPHWAKNFMYTSSEQIGEMYGQDIQDWLRVRNEADPEGVFLGEWHRRHLPLEADGDKFSLMEREVKRTKARDGGQDWVGEIRSSSSSSASISKSGEFITARPTLRELPSEDNKSSSAYSPTASASSSGESFDLVHGAEAQQSSVLTLSAYEADEDEGEATDRDERRTHGNPKEGLTGTKVFDKM
ncbi:D-arabinono-1,4-lactone oxidase [Oleoguttula sp. CCFEE 5521]